MSGSRLFNLGFNQKHFGGNNKIAGVSINLGCTKGRGSSTRMFGYCNQRSANPSECINQFITTPQMLVPNNSNRINPGPGGPPGGFNPGPGGPGGVGVPVHVPVPVPVPG
jgi:hypothetical protein